MICLQPVETKYWSNGSMLDSRPPRVGHKKSRKGCAQCKRRHVKASAYTKSRLTFKSMGAMEVVSKQFICLGEMRERLRDWIRQLTINSVTKKAHARTVSATASPAPSPAAPMSPEKTPRTAAPQQPPPPPQSRAAPPKNAAPSAQHPAAHADPQPALVPFPPSQDASNAPYPRTRQYGSPTSSSCTTT